MAPADNILRDFGLFIDQLGYAGNIDSLQPPKLALKTESHRTGGMDAGVPIDMGMEDLELGFELTKYDETVLSCFGEPAGKRTFKLKGALQSFGGAVTPVVIIVNGLCKAIELPSWKAGEKGLLKVTIGVTYYEYTQGGKLLHKIDIPKGIRIINGTDQLQAIRNAIA